MNRQRKLVVEALEGRSSIAPVQSDQRSIRIPGRTGDQADVDRNEHVRPTDYGQRLRDGFHDLAEPWSDLAIEPIQQKSSSKPERLLPGRSISQTATWNGTVPDTIAGVPLQNTSVNMFGNFVVSDPNAPSGLTASFQITDPITESLHDRQAGVCAWRAGADDVHGGQHLGSAGHLLSARTHRVRDHARRDSGAG